MSHLVDVHHHMLTPELVEALAAHDVRTVGGEPLPAWKPEDSLAVMDSAGIGHAVLSVPIPLHFLEPTAAATMARDLNRFAVDCTRRWPGRFGYFATLPLPDVAAAVDEAVDALDRGGASGVLMLSNHAGLYQGAEELAPLYAELDKRHAVAFVHPTVFTADRYPTQPGDGSPVATIQPSQLEFGFDSTRAVANLLFSETLERYPDIRFVFTHSAACVPSVVHKLLDRKPILEAYMAHMREHGTPPPVPDLLEQLESAESEARRRVRTLYFDTALSTAASSLRALTAVVPTSHILLGTDFPFGQEIGLRYTLRGIERYEHFSDEDLALIHSANATALLRREKTPREAEDAS